MKNGGRKCIRNGALKRRVGLALSDTLSTPNSEQKTGKKLNPKTGKVLEQKFRTSIGGRGRLGSHCFKLPKAGYLGQHSGRKQRQGYVTTRSCPCNANAPSC